MSFFQTTSLLAASGLVSLATGHMVMTSPSPFKFAAASDNTVTYLQKPLDASGADFPCKLASGVSFDTASSTVNTMALGSTQNLAFEGTAVHGGGSCQISLTTDEVPTASSTWKVIYSIEGGCPAQGQTGNLDESSAGAATAPDPYKYTFDVPSDIPTGNYTLAWTWFNKIGNREMYMLCAPASLTGTSGSQSNFDALPDMFVANVGNGCGTQDSKDVLFPQAGSVVTSMNVGTTAFATPTGTGCQASSAAAATTAAAGTATAGNAGNAAAGSSSKATSAAAAANTSAPAVSGGVFITSGAGAAPAAASTTKATTTTTAMTTVKVSSAAAAGTATAAASSASSSGTSTTTTTTTTASGALSGACTTEGEWNCIGGSSFQQCASGQWSAVESLAAGTSCTAGTSNAMAIKASTGKTRRIAVRYHA